MRYLRPNIHRKSKGFLHLLFYPKVFFKHHLDEKANEINIPIVVVSGMAFTGYFAELVSIGNTYPTGKIISAILILGPIVAILLFGLVGLVTFWTCNFIWGHRPQQLKKIEANPPFPLKNLVFRRIFGVQKLNNFFAVPGLSIIKKGWSNSLSLFRHFRLRIGKGKIQMPQLFSLLNQSVRPFLIFAVLMWLSVVFMGNSQFLLLGNGATGTIIFAVETILLVTCLNLWQVAVKMAYGIKALHSWMIVISVSIFTSLTTVGLVSFFTGIKLF